MSTVAAITEDVCEVIINNLWNDSVVNHFPKNEQAFREKMLDMEQMWQFPCCWSAIDGCHISIKCPPGGLESSKEYHSFKNFYSLGIGGELMHNQQGNMICLDIFTCYDTSS